MATTPELQSLSDYVTDGARIAPILLIWGVITVFFIYGVTEFTSSFERAFAQLGRMMWVVGIFNSFLYVFYRTVDYWDKTA